MKIEFHEGEPQSSRLCVPTLCAPILACSDNTQHTWQVIHILYNKTKQLNKSVECKKYILTFQLPLRSFL